jgi:hypothetical protein
VALGPWRCGGPQPLAGRKVLAYFYKVVSVSSSRQWRHPEIRIRSSRNIPDPAVRLAPAEGVWSRLPDGSPSIQSVFVFVGMVAGMALLI